MDTVIDKMVEEHRGVIAYLDNAKELSLRNIADDRFKKVLLLSAASYFEDRIRTIIIDFTGVASNNNEMVIAFVKSKAITRQYHTYFDWEGKNANAFFALFGSTFSDQAKKDVQSDANLEEAILAFLDIGKVRNALVHLNFASYFVEKTTDEIYELYKKSRRFIEYLERKLSQSDQQQKEG